MEGLECLANNVFCDGFLTKVRAGTIDLLAQVEEIEVADLLHDL